MKSELDDLRLTDPGMVRKIAREDPVLIGRLKALLEQNRLLGRGPQLNDREFRRYIEHAKTLVPTAPALKVPSVKVPEIPSRHISVDPKLAWNLSLPKEPTEESKTPSAKTPAATNAVKITASPSGLEVKVAALRPALRPEEAAKKPELIADLETGRHGEAAALLAKDPVAAQLVLDADRRERISHVDGLLHDKKFAQAITAIEAAEKLHGTHPSLKLLRCQADFARGRTEKAVKALDRAARLELVSRVEVLKSDPASKETRAQLDSLMSQRRAAPQEPLRVTPAVGDRGELFLQLGEERLAADHERFAEREVLVDVSSLPTDQFERVVVRLQRLEDSARGPNFTFRLSRNGEQHFAGLHDWESLRVLGDQGRLESLPEEVRGPITSWLQRLAAESRPDRGAGIQFVIDHFDRDGEALRNLTARIQAGDFRDQHLFIYICNSNRFAEYQAVSRLALEEGGALSVAIPSQVLQARVAPLVAEAMLRPQARLSTLAPAELGAQACREVRQQLERCLAATDVPEALRREFRADAITLFQNNGVFQPEIVRDMIRQLRSHETCFMQMVVAERPRTEVG